MRDVPLLPEVQRDFMNALYGDEAVVRGVAVASGVVGYGLDPAARLRIYRNSGTLIHLDVLRTAFPAVRALVGDDYFEQSAARYRAAHPSRSGNLQLFGAQFADFLDIQPETQALPYLRDVARLEWLRQECALAADAVALAPEDLLAALAGIAGPARLRLHPALRLLHSEHPVLALWRYAMDPGTGRWQAPARGEHILLWRRDGEVVMEGLDAADFACLAAIVAGASLDAAHAAACREGPAFDLTRAVSALLRRGAVVDLHEMEETP